MLHLDNSRILRQGRLWKRLLWLGRLADMDIFYVTPSEYNILEHLISRCHGSVCWSILCAKRSNCKVKLETAFIDRILQRRVYVTHHLLYFII